MSRSRSYETEEDIKRQEDFAAFLSKKLNLKLEATPKYFPVDYSIKVGIEVKGWLEIKTRNVDSSYYSNAICSVNKWRSMLVFVSLGTPVYYAIRYDDCDLMIKVEDREYQRSYISRSDRGNKQEEMLMIPVSEFRKV